MTKSLIKTISLLLIVGLTWTGVSAVKSTMAYFNDTEGYENNELVVGTLDFSLSSASDFSPSVIPTQGAVRYIDVINDGSLGFEYSVYASDFSGDTDLCNALNLTANLDGDAVEYSGDLTAFNYNAGEFIEPGNWEFTVVLDSEDPALEYKTCNFKFIFEAEQTGDCYGFNDIEEITNTVESLGWSLGGEKILINKVYHRVDSHHGINPDNEWIELYNNSDEDVDIDSWTISDNSGSDILAISELIIPSDGYAVISGSGTTWDYWNIPSDVIKIVLADGRIGGDGLGDWYDMLVLKNSEGNIVDRMNWGTPGPTWPNYDLAPWNPGCGNVPEGHILGRKPNGYDTDQPSDFWDYAPPEVSVSYHTPVWSAGGTYKISWTAENNNGPDEDLLIDLIYITDIDKSGDISDGDNFFLVQEKIANTGSYNFYVDCSKGYCYLGYVWVKVIAYGPENVMMQNYGVGPRVWEPPLPELEYNLDGTCRYPLPRRFRGMFVAPNAIETPTVPGVETTTLPEDGTGGTGGTGGTRGGNGFTVSSNTPMDIPNMNIVNTTTSPEDGTNPPDDNNENE